MLRNERVKFKTAKVALRLNSRQKKKNMFFILPFHLLFGMRVHAFAPMFFLLRRIHHAPLWMQSLCPVRRWRAYVQPCFDAHGSDLSAGIGTGKILLFRYLQKTFSSAPSGCVAGSTLPCVYNRLLTVSITIHCGTVICHFTSIQY